MPFQGLLAEFPEFYNQENEHIAASSRVGAHVHTNNQYVNACDSQSKLLLYERNCTAAHSINTIEIGNSSEGAIVLYTSINTGASINSRSSVTLRTR